MFLFVFCSSLLFPFDSLFVVLEEERNSSTQCFNEQYNSDDFSIRRMSAFNRLVAD